jgi:hypothetical protein
MTAIERWLAAAEADADRRGLPDLKPLLRGLAESTMALRAAAWNDRADDAATAGDPDRSAPPPSGGDAR